MYFRSNTEAIKGVEIHIQCPLQPVI